MAPIAAAVTRVLITGFGPFQGVPNNPSFAIASRLPTTLPNNIELIVYPSAVPVAYHPVVDLLPGLYNSTQPDLSLHIGVAEGRTYFAVEQTSQRNVYSWATDVQGQVFKDSEGELIWGDQSVKLSTDLDLQATVSDWQNRTLGIVWPIISSDSSLQSQTIATPVSVILKESVLEEVPLQRPTEHELADDPVRWSDAVGTYLCGFIYYAGMVQKSRTETVSKRKDVAFMHVPMLKTDEELDFGRDVTIELVQALVKSWKSQRAMGA
ncbi:peptidase C15, pyroglutamyl peptidase I-like protein [Massarina eburnea CBS 473.64]|uniref:Peptidase C15, pyroglutamyl peptidase I-like protein n=1 Tax=Massarina eburnea CBS 473.64 TaxID=1395130 RepID=A0A6A6SDU9_9PLEO|nr:peptidase C15, pyroglutamyl peptidase I-like protein [Massarina eburnea CBS 473.64]